MAYLHLRLNPPRPSFPAGATAVEGEAMAAHGACWRRHAAEGRAIAAGPVFERAGAFGIVRVEAADHAEAPALGAGDPVIGAGLCFRYDVAPVPSPILRGGLPADKTNPSEDHLHGH